MEFILLIIIIPRFCHRGKSALIGKIKIESFIPYADAYLHTRIEFLIINLIKIIVIPFITIFIFGAPCKVIAQKCSQVTVEFNIICQRVLITECNR